MRYSIRSYYRMAISWIVMLIINLAKKTPVVGTRLRFLENEIDRMSDWRGDLYTDIARLKKDIYYYQKAINEYDEALSVSYRQIVQAICKLAARGIDCPAEIFSHVGLTEEQYWIIWSGAYMAARMDLDFYDRRDFISQMGSYLKLENNPKIGDSSGYNYLFELID